ncbi:TPA: hypothetical protein EYP66_00680 [Candidatus Poribacteria bacterium]|nr:hypothetical protein [Candidatus Poribacteria bacterium]
MNRFDNVPSKRMMCLTIGACEVVWIFVREKNRGDITSAVFNQAIRAEGVKRFNPEKNSQADLEALLANSQ